MTSRCKCLAGLFAFCLLPLTGHAQAPPRLRADPVLTVGTPASGVSFSYIRDAASTPDGRVWVLDRAAPYLSLLAAGGRRETAVGHEGDGPGELRQPERIGRTPESLWVYDGGQGRVTLFRPDGRVAGTQNPRISLPPGWVFATPVAPLPGGGLVLMGMGHGPGAASQPNRGALLTQESSTNQATVVQSFELKNSTLDLVRTRINGHRSQGSARQPFSNDPVWSVARDGTRFVVATREAPAPIGAGTFTVTLSESSGRVLFNRNYSYPPRRLDDETVAGAVRHIEQPPGWPTTLQRVVDLAEVREKLYRPGFLPPLDEILLASDGRIWIRRSVRSTDTEALYLIMDDAGNLLGEIGLPKTARVLDARGTQAWVHDMSSEEEPILVRYEIHWR